MSLSYYEKNVSRMLSKYLRHCPQDIGLTLMEGGWVYVSDLIEACKKHGFPFTKETLQLIVENNDKKRFSFDSTGDKIRANQGHSVDVDLQLEEKVPPVILYHGTAKSSVPSILKDGLKKCNRHHVHLSSNRETAMKVGSRHGSPICLEINSGQMYNENYKFYQSENGVWLTDHVPVKYIANCKTQ